MNANVINSNPLSVLTGARKFGFIDELVHAYCSSDDVDTSKRWRRDWIRMFNKHLLPELSQVPINQLSADGMTRFVKQKFPDASPGTRAKYLTYMKTMFNWGVRMELIDRNPLAFVTRKSSPQKDLQVDKDLIVRMRDAAKPHVALAIEFIANTGVRPGPLELLSVQWKHFNWQDSTVRVRGKRGRWRTLPLKPEFLRKLELQREMAKTDYLIEYNGRGKLKGINQSFRTTCRKIGVDDAVILYDIRHWYCTMLLAKGVPVKTVSALMDHSTSRLTLDIYGHFIPGYEGKAIEVLPDLD